MNIDLTKLHKHFWFEDENGNMFDEIPQDDDKKKSYIYKSIWPCTYTESWDSYAIHKKINRKCRTFQHLASFNTSYSQEGQKTIVAMVNSGDYTLEEAIYVYCNACERCMNALIYKYQNGADGYPEYSEEWKKCNTECDWCRDDVG